MWKFLFVPTAPLSPPLKTGLRLVQPLHAFVAVSPRYHAQGVFFSFSVAQYPPRLLQNAYFFSRIAPSQSGRYIFNSIFCIPRKVPIFSIVKYIFFFSIAKIVSTRTRLVGISHRNFRYIRACFRVRAAAPRALVRLARRLCVCVCARVCMCTLCTPRTRTTGRFRVVRQPSSSRDNNLRAEQEPSEPLPFER